MTAPPAPVPVVDNALSWCVSTALAECLCTELAEVSAPAACCCLMPGEMVVWDDCTDGQAWVRLASIFPTSGTFPIPASAVETQSPCGGALGWAGVYEFGVLRCMPGPDENGVLPSCEEYAEVSRLVQADAFAMLRAAMCCDWRTACGRSDWEYRVGTWTPVGPEGGCVGGTLTVTVELTGCVCDPPAGEAVR